MYDTPCAQQQTPKTNRSLTPQQQSYKKILGELKGSAKAAFLNKDGTKVGELALKDISTSNMANMQDATAVVLDGPVTQRILDVSLNAKINTLVGTKMGNVTKQPTSITIWTRNDFE